MCSLKQKANVVWIKESQKSLLFSSLHFFFLFFNFCFVLYFYLIIKLNKIYYTEDYNDYMFIYCNLEIQILYVNTDSKFTAFCKYRMNHQLLNQ